MNSVCNYVIMSVFLRSHYALISWLSTSCTDTVVSMMLKDNSNIAFALHSASLQNKKQKVGMFIKEGYINYCILPENVAQNPSMGSFTYIAYPPTSIKFNR